MRQRHVFGPAIAAIAAICAAVDLCAIYLIMTGPGSSVRCGADWTLAMLFLILELTFGVPLVFAGAVGIALSTLPPLRTPKVWLISTAALCALATIVLIGFGAVHPAGSVPSSCIL